MYSYDVLKCRALALPTSCFTRVAWARDVVPDFGTPDSDDHSSALELVCACMWDENRMTYKERTLDW